MGKLSAELNQQTEGSRLDAIIIGAGHNGLVCGNYLAREGWKILVLESRSIIGGACTSEELIPGAIFSSCSYIQMMLRKEIIKELELKKYGLHSVSPDMLEMGLWEDGDHVMMWRDPDKTLRSVEKHNGKDGKNFMRFATRLRRFGELSGSMWMSDPPSLDELRTIFSETGEDELFNEFVLMSAEDLLSRYFESDRLRGFMMFMGIVSIWGGPRTPSTAYQFGYHAQGEFEGNYGHYGLPKGGMGSISAALAKSLEAHGGEIRTGTAVKRVIVKDGKATGVELTDGTVLMASLVISNADPVRSLTCFLGDDLPEPARSKAKTVDNRGSMARIHLLTDALPNYVGFEPGIIGPQHGGLVIMGATPARYEMAAEAQAQGRFPDEFVIETIIPSVTHPDLAPPGKHTVSLGVQQLPLHLAEGDWHSRRDEWADKVLNAYFKFAPNMRGHVLGRHIITPLDLQETYNITGGNIYHLSMVGPKNNFDQRPIPEAANYRTPVGNYYLCGSGSHPGGGVSGAPGHNAAKRILADHAGNTDIRATREDSALKTSHLSNLAMKLPLTEALTYQVAKNPLFRSLINKMNRTGK